MLQYRSEVRCFVALPGFAQLHTRPCDTQHVSLPVHVARGGKSTCIFPCGTVLASRFPQMTLLNQCYRSCNVKQPSDVTEIRLPGATALISVYTCIIKICTCVHSINRHSSFFAQSRAFWSSTCADTPRINPGNQAICGAVACKLHVPQRGT